MGNMGGIEKFMVFGILVIILVILGFAVVTSISVQDDLSSNRLKAGGKERVIQVLDQEVPEPGETLAVERKRLPSKPVASDVVPAGAEPRSTSTLPTVPLKLELPGKTRNSDPTGDAEKGTAAPENPLHAAGETASHKPITYTVKKGDSFRKIARILLGDEERYTQIMALNPDVDPRYLRVGQEILVPAKGGVAPGGAGNAVARSKGSPATPSASGRIYVVQKGDTLFQISRKFYGNASGWKKIYAANRAIIPDPGRLPVGLKLRIP